jgi:hypothetical protein
MFYRYTMYLLVEHNTINQTKSNQTIIRDGNDYSVNRLTVGKIVTG